METSLPKLILWLIVLVLIKDHCWDHSQWNETLQDEQQQKLWWSFWTALADCTDLKAEKRNILEKQERQMHKLKLRWIWLWNRIVGFIFIYPIGFLFTNSVLWASNHTSTISPTKIETETLPKGHWRNIMLPSTQWSGFSFWNSHNNLPDNYATTVSNKALKEHFIIRKRWQTNSNTTLRIQSIPANVRNRKHHSIPKSIFTTLFFQVGSLRYPVQCTKLKH